MQPRNLTPRSQNFSQLNGSGRRCCPLLYAHKGAITQLIREWHTEGYHRIPQHYQCRSFRAVLRMRRRRAREIMSRPQMAWLTSHPPLLQVILTAAPNHVRILRSLIFQTLRRAAPQGRRRYRVMCILMGTGWDTGLVDLWPLTHASHPRVSLVSTPGFHRSGRVANQHFEGYK